MFTRTFVPKLKNIRPLRHLNKVGLGGVFVWLSSGVAFGQTPTPAEAAQEGVRRQVERTREQQLQLQAKADVLQAPEPPVTLSKLPVESPCFVISKVIIAGTDAWRFRALPAAAEPVLKHCVGVQGLRQIASVLDAKLIALGYVTTRVSLPQQNLSDGTLSFSLHVGRVADVVMIKAGQPGQVLDDAWGTWRNAFP